jgi:hypothetical protein
MKPLGVFLSRAGGGHTSSVFVGLQLTAFGSSYYHLSPNNSRLVWDRLPMTIAFMSMVAAIIAERISLRIGLCCYPFSFFPATATQSLDARQQASWKLEIYRKELLEMDELRHQGPDGQSLAALNPTPAASTLAFPSM